MQPPKKVTDIINYSKPVPPSYKEKIVKLSNDIDKDFDDINYTMLPYAWKFTHE